jgi:hypothetical protein
MPAAPEPAALKRMTPEHIYQVLTTGDMKDIAKDISDADKRAIAVFVGGRRIIEGQSGDAKAMSNACSSNPPIRDLTAAPAWNGWGRIPLTLASSRERALACRRPRFRD